MYSFNAQTGLCLNALAPTYRAGLDGSYQQPHFLSQNSHHHDHTWEGGGGRGSGGWSEQCETRVLTAHNTLL